MTQLSALVTGSTRGIGLATAHRLLAEGFNVAVNGRGEAPDPDLLDELSGLGNAIYVSGNVGEPEDRRKLVTETLAAFGRIDVLVNNAGMTSPGRRDITEASEQDLDRVLAVNLKGPFFLTQAVARHMLKRGESNPNFRGRIINISSISSVVVSPDRADYCVSKAGLSMLTQLWAVRLAAAGIGVYEVRPGIIRTDMTKPVAGKYDRLINDGLVPEKRWGIPEDVAAAVAALADGRITYATGQVLTIDGGLTIPRL